jgi:hypothetical protein
MRQLVNESLRWAELEASLKARLDGHVEVIHFKASELSLKGTVELFSSAKAREPRPLGGGCSPPADSGGHVCVCVWRVSRWYWGYTAAP